MMISPNAYYEEYLRGKNLKELLKIIRFLSQEINRLKGELEDPELNPTMMAFPDLLTRIKCTREYLEMAKMAYEDVGGNYKLTRSERRDQEFNELLKHMKRFIFNYG